MTAHTTRFAPSPTGHLHVGGARTALFNYLLARQSGGTFIVRIEDTDRARHDESAVAKIVEDLRWLGIEWDEGIEVGGPAGPYRQSERLDLYTAAVDRLLAEGKAYHAFDTPEELDALREAAQAEKRGFKYPRPEEFPSDAEVAAARQAGRPVVVRFACPGHDVAVRDELFGQVTVPAGEQDDFIIRKADGYPTYFLANVVDDHAMGVTFVCRGQEFLGQTWRQTVLREALGHPEPAYAHRPLIMDMQGRKLSKRDGDVDVHSFRAAGYLPETMVTFLALLGWNPGDQREHFTLAELVDAFDVARVGKSNAKFDRDKLLAFNTDIAAAAPADRLANAFADYLALNPCHIPADDRDTLTRLIECCRGFRTFADVVAKTDILFAPDQALQYDPKAIKKGLQKGDPNGYAMLPRLKDALADLDPWTPETIEQWMQTFCQTHELGMGKVAQPLRVAITGTMVSPGIGDTLALAGKQTALRRIELAIEAREDT